MIKEKSIVENEETVETPVRKNEDSLEAYKEETAGASEQSEKRHSNASVDPAKFNWDEFEKAADYGAPKEEVEEEYDNTFSKVLENEVVEGTVTAMTKREVMVNIGYKSEGVISISEFRYNPDLKVGDKVDVYVESVEDRNGKLIVSHKKACALKSWDRVNEAYDKG